MKRGSHVHLIKHAIENPVTNYPTGYSAWGYLNADILPGEPIRLLRYARSAREPGEISPVECPGIFTSSVVVKVEGALVYTQNSVWEVVELSEDQELSNG